MFGGFWCNFECGLQFEDGVIIIFTILLYLGDFGDGCIFSTDCRHRESRDASRDPVVTKVENSEGDSFQHFRAKALAFSAYRKLRFGSCDPTGHVARK